MEETLPAAPPFQLVIFTGFGDTPFTVETYPDLDHLRSRLQTLSKEDLMVHVAVFRGERWHLSLPPHRLLIDPANAVHEIFADAAPVQADQVGRLGGGWGDPETA